MPETPNEDRVIDIAIIGGGINGAAIARDAAGRGWSVYLCEQDDLGANPSAAPLSLIHGRLHHLEVGSTRCLRQALADRDVLLSIAPHLVWPLRFVLPVRSGTHEAALALGGRFLSDLLRRGRVLPRARLLRLARDDAGYMLKLHFKRALELSDCWVDESRLAVVTARDAHAHGAIIETRTRCLGAERLDGVWSVLVEDEACVQWTLRARTLVNTARALPAAAARDGPPHAAGAAFSKLSREISIVLPRLYGHGRGYIFPDPEGRMVFVMPYEREFTLIGTVIEENDPSARTAGVSTDELASLCRAATAYFRVPVTADQVIATSACVHALVDGGAPHGRAAVAEQGIVLEAPPGAAPLLSVGGGGVAAHRRLAAAVVDRLAARLPSPASDGLPAGWTAREPLPGGDFTPDGFATEVAAIRMRYPFLPAQAARRLGRTYGTRVPRVLGRARKFADLGRRPGADLTETEIRYLVRREWATRAEDIVWRRTKLGLRMSDKEIAAVEAMVAEIRAELRAAEFPA